MKKLSHVLLIAIALGLSPRAFALFGVGDIVFDPTSFAQIVNLVNSSQQQISTLGGILGINTSQLTTLSSVLQQLGTADSLANFPRGMTMPQLTVAIRGLPGMNGQSTTDVSAFLNPSGTFDVFLGQSPNDWQQAVGSPLNYCGNTLMNRAQTTIGGNLGLSTPEVSYTQWVSGMAPADQGSYATDISVAAARLLANDYLQQAHQRRDTAAAFEAKIALDKQSAASATTTNQLLATENAETQTTNEILLHHVDEQQHQAEIEMANHASEVNYSQDREDREQLTQQMANLRR